VSAGSGIAALSACPSDRGLGTSRSAGKRRVVRRDAVAIERREREHVLAGRDAGPGCLDHSREHTDEHLPRTGPRPLRLLDRQLFGTARRKEPNDAHHATSE
jgi:hypothetical protein